MAVEKPIIVIVGPTASGKTGLAVKIAQKHNGEIISADSRAIYRSMDIGTAKPSIKEQAGIRHWGLDLVEPNERFTVADFQQYANNAIDDIRSRGKQPILVGGSGLYIDSIIYDYDFSTDYDEELRSTLEKMTVGELQKYCKKHNITLPKNQQNKRYLVRQIERNGKINNNREEPRDSVIVVGITTEKDVLLDRIKRRADTMFCDGLYDETKRLVAKYPFDIEAMKSNIYPIAWRLINGEITLDGAKALSVTDDWHLAKKQMTWFRRNPFIKWLPLDEIEQYISDLMK
ncbi:tRNA (adenosine(37)-N6)-dimethylallyltransferase MiaA [Alphaproteobacteria bacterium]|nr:tRNA (adenosine(37)-N6)-dimethylallyltransferase MiaA [Alphaproteobacteria bacterium]